MLSAANALNDQKDWVNELNVFPVPDGDTGTNMTMTIISAVTAMNAADDRSMEAVCRALSTGALTGARGNSGVILSQLLRGFCRIVQEKEVLERDDLVRAFCKAVESAYKAVMKPKEGTILTVARAMKECSERLMNEENVTRFFEKVVESGDEMLQKTPEMLPVLKEAGVVDSGGQGLMILMHGILDAARGTCVRAEIPVFSNGYAATPLIRRERPGEEMNAGMRTVDTSELSTADIRYGYCTEFIIEPDKTFTESDESAFKAFLETLGDSIVCVSDETVVKVHVHTDNPGTVLQKALGFGQLSRIKIDNMREEHEERLIKNASKIAAEQKAQAEAEKAQADAAKKEAEEKTNPRKENGFVVVCSGAGFERIFRENGADYIINGGQTMNPSTEEFINAITAVNAENVFVFPNNKNVILAANQAATMVEDRNVMVIPSTSVPQGISAMLGFTESASPDDNASMMQEVLDAVATIDVTYAVRDSVMEGIEVRTGDIMALDGKKILASGSDIQEAAKNAVLKAVTDETFAVTLYYGHDTEKEAAEALGQELTEALPDVDVVVAEGGQPIYYYVISVE